MKIVFFKEGGKVLTKKKKIFIICGMVFLLAVTAGLNLVLSKTNGEVQTSTYESASFLTSYRASKLETRQTMMNYYDTILASSTDPEQIVETNALIKDLASRMEKEVVLEGMIMASGYSDAVVTNADDSYTVMVKCDSMNSDDVAKILGILVKQTGVSASNVRITSV